MLHIIMPVQQNTRERPRSLSFSLRLQIVANRGIARRRSMGSDANLQRKRFWLPLTLLKASGRFSRCLAGRRDVAFRGRKLVGGLSEWALSTSIGRWSRVRSSARVLFGNGSCASLPASLIVRCLPPGRDVGPL